MSESEVKRKTVLVVEDADELRTLLGRWLEMHGYRAVEARNGQQAVEAALRERPDLILMDLSLPRVDGITATRRIREQEPLRGVPIVAVSAQIMEDFRPEALAAGCDEWVTKPIDLGRLEELLNRLLLGARKAGGNT